MRYEPSFLASYEAKRKRKPAKSKSKGFTVDNPLAEIDKDISAIMNPPAVADHNSALVSLGRLPKWIVTIVESDNEVLRAVMDKNYKPASPHKDRIAQGVRRPDELADPKLAEHWIQVRLFYHVERHHPDLYPFMFSVPNGGYRTPKAANMMSYEGQKSGVQDIVVALPRGKYHGLFLEVKTEKGAASKIQKETQDRFARVGYCCLIEKGFERCLMSLIDYYSLPLFDGVSILAENA